MVIVSLNTRRCTISSTPSTPLSSILEDAVRTFGLSEKYSLLYNDKVITLLLPLRLAGIATSARLKLSKVVDAPGQVVEIKKDGEKVKVDVNTRVGDIGTMVMGRLLSEKELSMTLWEAGVRSGISFVSSVTPKPLENNVSTLEAPAAVPLEPPEPEQSTTSPQEPISNLAPSFAVYSPSTAPLAASKATLEPEPTIGQLKSYQSSLTRHASHLTSFSSKHPTYRDHKMNPFVEVKVRFPDSTFLISTFPAVSSIHDVKNVLADVVTHTQYELLLEKRLVKDDEVLRDFYEPRLAFTMVTEPGAERSTKEGVEIIDARIDAERRQAAEPPEEEHISPSIPQSHHNSQQGKGKKKPKWFKMGSK